MLRSQTAQVATKGPKVADASAKPKSDLDEYINFFDSSVVHANPQFEDLDD